MAQSNITISNFAAAPGTDGAPTTITFNIEWAPPEDEDKVWSDTVWVFVDYNNAGTMTRLPLAPGATLTNPSWNGAKVIEVPDNDNGVWVVGNARTEGTFTATIRAGVGAGFKPAPTGMCIYAINYPPRGQYTAYNQIKFNGTPPFYLTYADASTATVVRETAAETYTLKQGTTLASFTDASLAPGVTKCKTPDLQTLQSSATVYCAGDAGVTLSLSSTEEGAIYRLWKGDDDAGSVTGNGSAMTFTNQHQKGTYTATVEATAQFCAATLTSRVTVPEATQPASAGQLANTCGCDPASADCSGTCTASATTTVPTACSSCRKSKSKVVNQCGITVNEDAGEVENLDCTQDCCSPRDISTTQCTAKTNFNQDLAICQALCRKYGMREISTDGSQVWVSGGYRCDCHCVCN